MLDTTSSSVDRGGHRDARVLVTGRIGFRHLHESVHPTGLRCYGYAP
jgi:hypothetical protein